MPWRTARNPPASGAQHDRARMIRSGVLRLLDSVPYSAELEVNSSRLSPVFPAPEIFAGPRTRELPHLLLPGTS